MPSVVVRAGLFLTMIMGEEERGEGGEGDQRKTGPEQKPKVPGIRGELPSCISKVKCCDSAGLCLT